MTATLRLPAPARAGAMDRWWLPVCALLLAVASDFDWRVRDVTASLAGQADIAVMIEVAAYGAVAAYLIIWVLDPPGAGRLEPLLVFVWGFAVTVAASAIYAPSLLLAVARGVQLLVVAMLCQAIATKARRDQLHRMVHGYIALCAVAVAVGFVAPFPRLALEANRFNFLYVHPLDAATILGIGAVCCVAYLIAARRGSRWAPWPAACYGALFLWLSLAVVLTITRSVMAATLVAGGVMAFVAARGKQRIDLVVFGLIAVALTAMVAGAAIADFLIRGQTAERLLSLNSRTTLWEAAAQRFSERPLTGHGVTAARSIFLDDIGLGGAHNAFVEVAVSNGVVGLVWWIGLLLLLVTGIVLLHPAGRPASTDVILIDGLFVFLVVNGVSTEGAGTPANVQALWLMLIAGWVVLLQRERRQVAASGARPLP